ncbi:hypothetical protein [Streptomyces sp. NPDC059928]|uniref:hypothetical protein n=1 Tax=unclassified Streptomyces TaxID=2593676 RepID=UPI00365D51C7
MRGCGKSERDRAGSREAAGLFSLAAQEGEGEVEAIDLTSPVFGDGAFAAGQEVLLQQPDNTVRIHRSRRATSGGLMPSVNGPAASGDTASRR